MSIPLQLSAISKQYLAGVPGCSARTTVLVGVQLAVWPGEIVAVVGARGCGITTLLRCAAGLLRPDEGVVAWRSSRVRAMNATAYVSGGGEVPGALYTALHAAVERGATTLLVDDLSLVTPLERRLCLAVLRERAARGSAIVIAADEQLARDPCVSRVMMVENCALTQRRKRSAARIASSSPASRARASARSTYGRSLRSPQ